MNHTIEVSTETAGIIESQAKLRGLSVEDYLKSLIPKIIGNGNGNSESNPLYETATPQELADAYLAWAESHKSNAPALALEDIRRETIY